MAVILKPPTVVGGNEDLIKMMQGIWNSLPASNFNCGVAVSALVMLAANIAKEGTSISKETFLELAEESWRNYMPAREANSQRAKAREN